MKKIILLTFITIYTISQEVTVLHIEPSKSSYKTDNEIRGKIISSGEIEIEPGKTNIYTAITNSDGYISISNHSYPYCKITIRNNKGKILAETSILNLKPQIKVRANEIYYIYAKARNPRECKSFEIFIP